MGFKLVSAQDLESWAETYDSSAELPRLVRRLVSASSGRQAPSSFDVGKGVGRGGFDGRVQSPFQTEFLPEGYSFWELSTDNNPAQKAEADYKKRTAEVPKEVRGQATYIGVTLRKWAGSNSWAQKKNSTDEWREVKFYDCEDLESWLESEPTVRYWLAEILKKATGGVQTLEAWWDDWARITRPKFEPSWLRCGRHSQVTRFLELLGGTDEWISITNCLREEAIGLVYSAIVTLDEETREDILGRVLVVDSPATWQSLCATENKLFLIPAFDQQVTTLGQGVRQNRVILCDAISTNQGNCVDVPLVDANLLQTELQESGLTIEQSIDYAKAARSSVYLLRNKLGDPTIPFDLAGVDSSDYSLITALLLLNRWNGENEHDRKVVSDFAGRAYEDIESWLNVVPNGKVPIFRKSGSVWFVTDSSLAWAQLQSMVDAAKMHAFGQVALSVLSDNDPSYELDSDKRWASAIYGKTPNLSSTIKSGVSRTLLLLAVMDIQFSTTLGRSQPFVDGIVKSILNGASPERWYSLAYSLQDLAEASPTAFFDSLEEDLRRRRPNVVKGLFAPQDSVPFGGSRHSHLLWALERLAWSRDYILRVSQALMTLATKGFGAGSGNNPHHSLRSIFLAWCPRTYASVDDRLEVLAILRQDSKEVIWKLMVGLLWSPHSSGEFVSSSAAERFSQQEYQHPSHSDAQKTYVQVLDWCLEDAGEDSVKWSDLLDKALTYRGDWFSRVCEKLESLNGSMKDAGARDQLWELLSKSYGHQVRSQSFDWGMNNDELARLSKIVEDFLPVDVAKRYVWLFESWPRLAEPYDSEDYDGHESRLKIARLHALTSILESKGHLGIVDFSSLVEQPGIVGQFAAIGNVWSGLTEDKFLQDQLASNSNAHRWLSRGFSIARFEEGSYGWIESKLKNNHLSSEQRGELLLSADSGPTTWTRVALEPMSVQDYYWDNVRSYIPGTQTSEDAEFAISKILDRKRFVAALDYMSMTPPGITISSPLMLRALEQLREFHTNELPWQSLVSDIERVMDKLDEHGDVPNETLVSLEFFFMPLLEYRREPVAIGRSIILDPSTFVELLKFAFKPHGEPARDISDEEMAMASTAYSVLDKCHPFPDSWSDVEGGATKLLSWAKSARKLAKQVKRIEIADTYIGKIAAESPNDPDGYWPHRNVCELIETLRSSHFQDGFLVGRRNSRGWSSRAHGVGGQPERERAQEYHAYADKIRFKYPRTALLLEKIEKSYLWDAEHQDRRLNMEQDLG